MSTPEMLELILELILEPIFAFVFLFGGYFLGYLPVVLVTLGGVEPEPLERAEDREFHRSVGMKWWHLTYVYRDTRYLPAEAVALTGWVCISLFIAAVWLVVEMVV